MLGWVTVRGFGRVLKCFGFSLAVCALCLGATACNREGGSSSAPSDVHQSDTPSSPVAETANGTTADQNSPPTPIRFSGPCGVEATGGGPRPADPRGEVPFPPAGMANLGVKHPNASPVRLSTGCGGRLYVTDTRAHSLFIYEPDLTLIGELKGLQQPLGVAVDLDDRIYVGNDGRNNVEVYDQDGVKLRAIGEGIIEMPNELALDSAGNLYVADSRANLVRIFTPEGEAGPQIGSGQTDAEKLEFPVSVVVREAAAGGEKEVLVADQGRSRIAVFDEEGSFLRAYGQPVEAFSSEWKGRFVRMQALAIDSAGRLHVLDSFMSKVQVLDAGDGAFLSSYGKLGTEDGDLYVALDLVVTAGGTVLVANSGRHRVEVIHQLPELADGVK